PEGPFGGLSGARYWGFGHGVAGVCLALLHAYARSNDKVLLDTAQEGLHTLAAAAQPIDDDAVWWPVSAKDETAWNAWCHGTPGIVKTLSLAALSHGDVNVLALLRRAVRGMALANNAGWCLCHGLCSRVDARVDAARVEDPGVRELVQRDGPTDAHILEGLDGESLVPASGVRALGDHEGQGLMTGTLGLYRTLLRWRRLGGGGRLFGHDEAVLAAGVAGEAPELLGRGPLLGFTWGAGKSGGEAGVNRPHLELLL
ncbi:MAG: hypothetical protein HYV26_05860, partial [Candidatus Hydrogenedentes bacterium]|nr:hypothetical protein [Candidatus Hydrogenedentota bacterium]